VRVGENFINPATSLRNLRLHEDTSVEGRLKLLCFTPSSKDKSIGLQTSAVVACRVLCSDTVLLRQFDVGRSTEAATGQTAVGA